MIIRDVNGYKLILTKNQLKESTGEVVPGDKWTLDLSELTKPNEGPIARIRVYLHRVDDVYGNATGECFAVPSRNSIGCRTFTVKTFNRIMRAALDLKAERGK
jgi:hypothetical protein